LFPVGRKNDGNNSKAHTVAAISGILYIVTDQMPDSPAFIRTNVHPDVHTAGGGKKYTQHVHTAGGGKEYTLVLHSS
jgi:hypothetical protein